MYCLFRNIYVFKKQYHNRYTEQEANRIISVRRELQRSVVQCIVQTR